MRKATTKKRNQSLLQQFSCCKCTAKLQGEIRTNWSGFEFACPKCNSKNTVLCCDNAAESATTEQEQQSRCKSHSEEAAEKEDRMHVCGLQPLAPRGTLGLATAPGASTRMASTVTPGVPGPLMKGTVAGNRPSHRALHVNDLSSDVLQYIMQYCSTEDRVMSCPLVCQRWRGVLREASVAWRHIDLEWIRLVRPKAKLVVLERRSEKNVQVCFKRLADWFHAREGCVEKLETFSAGWNYFTFPWCSTMSALYLSILPHVKSTVTSLIFHAPVSNDVFHLVPQCTGLQELCLNVVGGCPGEVLCPLTNLQYLEMRCHPLHGGLSPVPSDVTNLTALTELQVSVVSSMPDNLGALCNLQSLTVEAYFGDHFPRTVTQLLSLASLKFSSTRECPVPLECLSSFHSLRSLMLHGCGVEDAVRAADTTLPLTHCEMTDCYLYEVPKFLHGLTCVKHLDLSANSIRTLPSWISTLRSLQSLHVETLNIPWELTALTTLTQLLVAPEYPLTLRTHLGRHGDKGLLMEWDSRRKLSYTVSVVDVHELSMVDMQEVYQFLTWVTRLKLVDIDDSKEINLSPSI